MNNRGIIYNVNIATMANGNYSILTSAALAWENGTILWLGLYAEIPEQYQQFEKIDGRGNWLLPGLIDCHTHVIYAGNRANEFEARLNGASYSDIAREGGGILSTVRATRGASEQELLAQTLPRVDALLREGVTTLEIKSGYGLTFEDERKMLRVAREIGMLRSVTVRTSFLAAHALPPEFAGLSDNYIDACIDWLSSLNEQGLIDAVDGFCENIAFSPQQISRLFTAASQLDIPVKLHAEQLSNQSGSALVASYGGLSADHLEWLDNAGIAAMAKANTTAVLLPGAFYYLRETRLPPINNLREANVGMAIATDCNPGSSPLTSLLTAANMACVLFNLTPEEALAGITVHAAKALGLNDRGVLNVGYRADFALWNIQQPVDLVYSIGKQIPITVWHNGVSSS